MRKSIALATLVVITMPLIASAQSLEWIAEHPGAVTPALQQTSTTPAISSAPTPAPQPPPVINTNDGLEAKVRAYFSDIPAMANIAECESRFRQFDENGNALDGGAGGMIGLFQINASVHASVAKSMGMDIYTAEGNMAYARYLYQQDGTDPWLDSFSCWHKTTQSQVAAGGNNALTQDLVLGTISPEVKALQVMLNAHGYVLATDGPGSPGQETTKFGSLTREAVRRFQCERMQICSGDENSTGFGLVGATTRNALIALAGDTPIAAAPVQTANTGATASSDQDAQIAALKKQIAELTAQLAALTTVRHS